MKRVLAIATILVILGPFVPLPALAVSFSGVSGSAAGSTGPIDCNGFGIFDCDNDQILAQCMDTCVSRCTQLLPDPGQIVSHPELCTICAKIAASPAGGPVSALLTAGACARAAGAAAAQALCSNKGPLGCCISDKDSPKITVGDGVCTNEVENCIGESYSYSCCICTKGGVTQKISNSRDNYDSCAKSCSDAGLDIDKSFGAGTLFSNKSAKSPSAAAIAAVNQLCFTPADCAKPEYGGSTTAFRAGQGCPTGKGRCVAPEPDVKLGIPIGSVTTVKGMRDYINKVFQYALTVVAVAAAVMFVYGGFRYITGSAFGDIQKAKEIMVDSSVGLLLLLGAVTILNTVNPATTTLKMPEIYMINQEVNMQAKWCKDLTKSAGNVKFAEAGPAPNYTDPGTITTFPLTADQTRCTAEYYAEGMGGNRCEGQSCEHLGKGYSCADCAGGSFPGCNDKKSGTACVKAQWTGTVTWTGEQTANSMKLFAVCGFAQNDKFDSTKDNMFEVGKVTPTVDEASKKAPYSVSVPAGAVASAEEKCKANGNGNSLRGFVLGVQYKSTTSYLVVALEYGGYVIVTKDECNGAGKFAGYADNTYDFTDAYWCGLYFGDNKLMHTENYWSADEIQAAVDEKTPINCDVNFNDNNAVDNPTKAFYGKQCTGGTR